MCALTDSDLALALYLFLLPPFFFFEMGVFILYIVSYFNVIKNILQGLIPKSCSEKGMKH